MTTIVGLSNKYGAVIAGDSRITTIDQTGYATQISTLPNTMAKVIQTGEYIIGASGDLRAINLIQHAFTPPPPPKNPDKQLPHIINKFIPELRQTFDDHGYSLPQREQSNHIAEHSSTILIAVKGQIFCIDGDYSVMGEHTGTHAIGTGAQYALGCLHTYRHHLQETHLQGLEQIALHALNTASTYDPHTAPPHTCHTTPTKKGEKHGRT